MKALLLIPKTRAHENALLCTSPAHSDGYPVTVFWSQDGHWNIPMHETNGRAIKIAVARPQPEWKHGDLALALRWHRNRCDFSRFSLLMRIGEVLEGKKQDNAPRFVTLAGKDSWGLECDRTMKSYCSEGCELDESIGPIPEGPEDQRADLALARLAEKLGLAAIVEIA